MTSGTNYCHILRIEPHPGNIRADLGDVTELADSIREQGILQPLIVEPKPGSPGRYILLAGHRRHAAAQLAGLIEVPIVVTAQRGPGHAIEVMLVENCQRRDLGPVEKAEAMGRLRDLHHYSQARIARAIGLSQSTVTYYLSLLELSAASREKVRAGDLPMGDAIAAVRRTRKRQRKAAGGAPVGAEWEPDHFTGKHPLARKAAALCEAREHTMRRRIGRVACGQCWETVIRQDEQLVQALATAPAEGKFMAAAS